MEGFTPISASIGGLLIGASAATMLLARGKIAGISGILGGLLRPGPDEAGWRLSFLAGLVLGGLVGRFIQPLAFEDTVLRRSATLVLAGLLVGFGTRLGNGCTSGHGVCGVGRLSTRSMVATGAFVGIGILTTYVCNHLLAGRV